MVKCLENQGYENTASTRKVIIYVNKFFNCLNSKKKNEGARKRNDELRPYVSAEYARLKLCNLLLHSQAFIQALLPVAVFPQRFSFFTVCLVYCLREVPP